jgi:hypothetical protein
MTTKERERLLVGAEDLPGFDVDVDGQVSDRDLATAILAGWRRFYVEVGLLSEEEPS